MILAYLVICHIVDGAPYVYFFHKVDRACAKYGELSNYGDTRLYVISLGKIERYYPETGIFEVVKAEVDLFDPTAKS